MLELDVHVQLSKGLRADPAMQAKLAPAIAIAKATAPHIRRRVIGGVTASRPVPYNPDPGTDPKTKRKKRFYISPAYAEKLGLGDQTRWESSAALHSAVGTRAGSGHMTGGMWQGLQARNFGKQGAVIDFRGSSIGASSVRSARTQGVVTHVDQVTDGTDIKTKKRYKYEVSRDSKTGKLTARRVTILVRDEGGNVKYRRKPKLVRNSRKAGIVFKHSRVGVLQPTERETQAQLAAVAYRARGLIVTAFQSDIIEDGGDVGDRRLYAAARRALDSIR